MKCGIVMSCYSLKSVGKYWKCSDIRGCPFGDMFFGFVSNVAIISTFGGQKSGGNSVYYVYS